jgi:hypothetical protein
MPEPPAGPELRGLPGPPGSSTAGTRISSARLIARTGRVALPARRASTGSRTPPGLRIAPGPRIAPGRR